MDTVTFYNTALDHCEGTNIQSATGSEPNSIICQRYHQIALDNALEKYDWTFAREFATLNYREIPNPEYDAVTNPDVPINIPETTKDWAYTFDLPNDFLALRVIDDHEEDEYEVLGQTICSNQDELHITFTTSLRIVENFPNPFSEAAALILSWYVCRKVSGYDKNQRQALFEEYSFFLKVAQNSDRDRQVTNQAGEYTFVEE